LSKGGRKKGKKTEKADANTVPSEDIEKKKTGRTTGTPSVHLPGTIFREERRVKGGRGVHF